MRRFIDAYEPKQAKEYTAAGTCRELEEKVFDLWARILSRRKASIKSTNRIRGRRRRRRRYSSILMS